jgi:hypothetical protein
MAVERPRITPEIQQRFIQEYGPKHEVIEPEKLFIIDQHDNKTFARIYMRPSTRDEGRFGIRAAAFYNRGADLPTNAVVLNESQWELRLRDDWLQVVGIDTETNFELMTDYTPHGELYSIGAGSRVGQEKYYRSPYILELEERRENLHDLLARSSTEYDTKTGIVTYKPVYEGTHYILKAPRRIEKESVLNQLFTSELQLNPETASTKHDLWERANWLEIVGLSWKKHVEADVFPSN